MCGISTLVSFAGALATSFSLFLPIRLFGCRRMNSLCAFSTHAKEKTKNKTFFFFFFWEIILLLQKIFFLFYFFFSFSSLFFFIFLSVTLAACEVEKSVVIISEKERESAVTRCLTGMSRLARQDERRARVTRNICWASKRQLLREEAFQGPLLGV